MRLSESKIESSSLVDNSRIRGIRTRFEERYECEELRKKQENEELIKGFSGGKHGKGIEKYLKERAWKADEQGSSKGYYVLCGKE